VDIKKILKKVADGKELTAEETAFLAKYDPENDESRIPKSRLDQEIAKVKAEKERADALDTKVTELTSKVDELEAKGMTDVEKANAANAKELKSLRTQVDALTKERDDAKANLAKSERTAQITAIASKHNFSNPNYLDYLADSKGIDTGDESAVASFMKELGTSNPELFTSTAKPGGGTGGGGGNDTSVHEARLKELMGKPELSSREAGEVIDLQSKINAGKSETETN
jgi:cell division protein FtsL